jgi:DNA-binding transcriptional MerR regulator
MEDVRLTAGDVQRITGVAPMTLNRWIADGFLSPENSGRGHGHHRLYTLCDVIAIAAGLRFKDEGAGPDRVRGVVRLVSGLGMAELRKQLAQGRWFPAPGAMLDAEYLPGFLFDPDVEFNPLEMSLTARALLKKLDLRKVVANVERSVAKLVGTA